MVWSRPVKRFSAGNRPAAIEEEDSDAFCPGFTVVAVIKVMLVGVGGFVGAVLRFGVSGLVQGWSRSIGFPYGTLAVNVLGCLVIGILAQMVASRGMFSPELRLFVFIGVLGSFTTFSTFGNETFSLLQDGETIAALAYVGFHLLAGLGAVWLGHVMALQIWG